MMINRINIVCGLMVGLLTAIFAVPGYGQLSVTVRIAEELRSQWNEDGRVFLFLSEHPTAEPRRLTWPSPRAASHIFARNLKGVQANKSLVLSSEGAWDKTSHWGLDQVPVGTYTIQVVWDQDPWASNLNAPGNLYSTKQQVEVNGTLNLDIALDQVIPPLSVADHELVREIEITSDTLSAWWGHPVKVKASLLLPSGYDPAVSKDYPIRYNVAGYGGRYTRVNRLANSAEFMNWWTSDEAPEIINVFLDGEGPFGDSYQMDSENSGPYGYSLIHELIPYIENQYREGLDASTRFVDGCSTGGWVSLGLQFYYPDMFNGVYSYSPDAIDFTHYQLINIYKDKNAFVNEFHLERPVMRDIYGEPMLSLRRFISHENVQGSSGTYLNSGGQFSAHAALYSPRGEDGLPKPLFDPVTGTIDPEVAEHWKKYDFAHHLKENWETLGPKLDGKIYIWAGDMDQFYLNMATRSFADFLESTTHPTSDAVIEFEAMRGHCADFSHRKILQKIEKRVEDLD